MDYKGIVLAGAVSMIALAQSAYAQSTEQSDPSTVQSQGSAGAPVAPDSDEVAPPPSTTPGNNDLPSEAANREEIVVTGSRNRAEAVQSTPIAVSVTGQAQLEALHAPDIRGLTATIPNLQISQLPNNAGAALVYLRGFGAFSADASIEPGIAIYVDGIYQTVQVGSLSELADVEKIEVLRGPQSTIMGKNASAGGVLVTRTRPTFNRSFKFNAEYGRYNLVNVNALFNTPLVEDVLALKLFAAYRDRDGYADNIANGDDFGKDRSYTLRAALLFTPTDNLKFYLAGNYQRFQPQQGPTRSIHPNPSVSPVCIAYGYCTSLVGRPRTVALDNIHRVDNKTRDVVLNGEWDLDPVKITSITGYKRYNSHNYSDTDASPFLALSSYNQEFRTKDFSQELRLTSQEDGPLTFGGRLNWTLGAYYSKAKIYMRSSQASLSAPVPAVRPAACTTATGLCYILTNQAQFVTRTGKAIFGQADFEIVDGLTASFGVRRSWDKTQHDYSCNSATSCPTPFPRTTPPTDARDGTWFVEPALAFTQTGKFTNTSFEGGLRYEFDDTKMIYVRYAEGYRGGGFTGLPANQTAAAVGYRPETSESYEVGVKTQWFDRRLLVNLTAFRTKFYDLQRVVSGPVPNPPFFVSATSNAATARIQGIELESSLRLGNSFRVTVTGGYLDPEYLSYESRVNATTVVDLSDQPFPWASKYTFSVIPSYDFDLGSGMFTTLNVQGKYSYVSRQYVSGTFLTLPSQVQVGQPELFQPGYGTFDIQASLIGGGDENYKLTAYVTNVTNKNYINFGSRVGGPPISLYVIDNPGRVWGVVASLKF